MPENALPNNQEAPPIRNPEVRARREAAIEAFAKGEEPTAAPAPGADLATEKPAGEPVPDPTKAPAPEKPADMPAKPDDALGVNYAKIAARERAALEKAQKARAELEAERAALEAEKAQIKGVAQLVERAKGGDPQAILDLAEQNGWDIKKLNEWRLTGIRPDAAVAKRTEAVVDAKTKPLEERLAKTEKNLATVAEREQAAQTTQARAEVARAVETNPKYELLKASGEAGKLYEVVLELHKSEGRPATEQALQQTLTEVADAAEQQLRAQAKAFMVTGWAKSQGATSPAPAKPATDPALTTLSNDVGGEPVVKPQAPAGKPRTREEMLENVLKGWT